jgi:hypothetical protein
MVGAVGDIQMKTNFGRREGQLGFPEFGQSSQSSQREMCSE